MDRPSTTTLLGGISAEQFMRRHWQREPLLVRGAWPGLHAPVDRAALFRLASRDDVSSRAVIQEGRGWRLQHGPFGRRDLPSVRQPRWTLLVQGVDQQLGAAQAMLSAFRFLPSARLDDLMVSWASDGGGVGPHLDSYDVFLVQFQGVRRWRIGRAADRALVPGVPLKILRRFEPEQEWLLEAGDMLYLPPGWAHEGVAVGECMTGSVGFRAPRREELVQEILLRMADAVADAAEGATDASCLYGDAGQPAVHEPARVPSMLQRYARRAMAEVLRDRSAWDRALGEWLSDPKPTVVFQPPAAGRPDRPGADWTLAPGTRMYYDDEHLFINGESYRAEGADADLMRSLADTGRLRADQRRLLSRQAREVVRDWLRQGWLLPQPPERSSKGSGKRSGKGSGNGSGNSATP